MALALARTGDSGRYFSAVTRPLPVRLLALVASAAALACAATPTSSARGDAIPEQRRSEVLAHSLFRVAVPKDEDPRITYTQPLPVDQLPFRTRTTNGIVRGTAFAVGSNRFVTATSVLPWSDVGAKQFYLVDANGVSTEITRITRYSQYRNLVEFEVKVPPPGLLALELAREEPRVGDTLTAAGTVAGDEVLLPDSVVTALSPEEIAGAWHLIRFTTPATLATSGGPILDRAGRVVGVVTRVGGPSDALNDAVPSGQLDKMSSSSADFWIKGARFGEDNQQIFADWKFETPVPTSLPELWAAVARSRLDLYRRLMADFDAQHAGEVFPREPNLQAFLRHPVVPYGFGRFALDGNRRWSFAHETYTRREIAPGQFVSFARNNQQAELLIDRPPGTPLLQFFQSPKALAEMILKVLEVKRPYAGQSILVQSLGEPAEQSRWVDALGRPWFTNVWRLDFAGSAFVASCLTNPGGLACDWRAMPIGAVPSYLLEKQRSARRTTFVYYGHLKDWTEFLALPADFKPRALSAPADRVRFDGGALTLELGAFRGHLGSEVPGLSEASVLSLFLIPDGTPSFGLRAHSLRLKPRSDKDLRFDIEPIYAPTDGSSEANVQTWNKLKTGEPPYDGGAAFDGKENAVRLVRKPTHAANPEVRYLYACRNGPEDDKAALQKSCGLMTTAITVDERWRASP